MDLLLLNNSNLNILVYEKRLGFRLRVIHRNLSISQSAMGIAVFIVFIAMTVAKDKQDLCTSISPAKAHFRVPKYHPSAGLRRQMGLMIWP